MADRREDKKHNEQFDNVQLSSTSYKMDNPPLGIQQLMAAGEVELVQEYICCGRACTVSSPQTGIILHIKCSCNGRSVRIRDTEGTKIAKGEVHMSVLKMCTKPPHITVDIKDAPGLVMQPKRMNSYTIIIIDEKGQPVLDVWRKDGLSCEYKITNAVTKADVCTIKKDFLEYWINFPIDMDVRYKLALIALCAFETPNNMNQHRAGRYDR